MKKTEGKEIREKQNQEQNTVTVTQRGQTEPGFTLINPSMSAVELKQGD